MSTMPNMGMNPNPVLPTMPTQPIFQTNALNNYNPNPFNPVVPNTLNQPLPPHSSTPYDTSAAYGQLPQPPRARSTNQVPAFAPQPTNHFSSPAPVNPTGSSILTPGNPALPPGDNPYAKSMAKSDFGNTPGWNDPPAFTKSAKSQVRVCRWI